MRDRKKEDEWDKGYKTAIDHVLAVISRANIDSSLKTVWKSRIKKLKTEVEMSEARHTSVELP